MFKNVIIKLTNNGHDVSITINTKDILEQLMLTEKVPFLNILKNRRSNNSRFSAMLTLLKKEYCIFKLQRKQRYEIFVGTETALAHIGWIFRIKTFIMVEDDASVIPEAAMLSFPFAQYIVSPVSCDLGRWSEKKISYEGYQKLCYLHPKYFTPLRNKIRGAMRSELRYFMIRVSALSAYHDNRTSGFTLDILRTIVNILKDHGEIIISTEKQLPSEFSQYLFGAKLSEIHHYLYFSDLLIADSQSMCVEAAVLGTPSLRLSDFAGKIGVLEELEHKYKLTYGFNLSETGKLYKKLAELLSVNDLRNIWQARRQKMLSEKIDVTAFWTKLIENAS